MTIHTDPRTIPELFSDALAQFSKLLRNEIQLARTEMSGKLKETMNGVAFLIAGALFVGPAIVLLLIALATFLAERGLPDSVAYLLSGLVGLAIAGVLASIGMKRVQNTSMTPDRTMRQINRDVAAVKEQV